MSRGRYQKVKKVIKVIGIIILVIVAIIIFLLVKNYIDSQKPYIKDDYYTEFQSESELEGKYAGLGSYEVSSLELKSDDKTLGKIRVWYPAELKNGNKTYPLIVVTNASNMAALNYKPFFERLASWGFIVVGNDDRQAGTGESTSKTLDFVLNLNGDSTSVLHGKVNTESIGCIGYSQGGAGAINAVTAFDNSDKFTALFTGSAAYQLLANNMGWGYDISKVRTPYFMTAGTGTSDDAGASDIATEYGGVAPLASLIENYNGISADVMKIRARITGAEHGDMQTRTDGYMTAWMLYQLCGDEEAGKALIGDNAELLTNANWQDIEKNG